MTCSLPTRFSLCGARREGRAGSNTSEARPARQGFSECCAHVRIDQTSFVVSRQILVGSDELDPSIGEGRRIIEATDLANSRFCKPLG
jgi:hypothetical protein